jgi:hypothetical protein
MKTKYINDSTGWRTKCHTIDCTHNTFLLLQKHLTSGTELIIIRWKTVPKEHVQCYHRFASQPLPNEPLHSSQGPHSEDLCKVFTMWALSCATLPAILQTRDIYRIFHELPHSLARLQQRYYDVTILMG